MAGPYIRGGFGTINYPRLGQGKCSLLDQDGKNDKTVMANTQESPSMSQAPHVSCTYPYKVFYTSTIKLHFTS